MAFFLFGQNIERFFMSDIYSYMKKLFFQIKNNFLNEMQLFSKVEKRSIPKCRKPSYFFLPAPSVLQELRFHPLQTSSTLFTPECDLRSEIASIQIFICMLFEAISTHFSILLQAKCNTDIGMKRVYMIRRITNSSTEQI